MRFVRVFRKVAVIGIEMQGSRSTRMYRHGCCPLQPVVVRRFVLIWVFMEDRFTRYSYVMRSSWR